MKICYFGSYNPLYARNRVLIKGLKQNGASVLECSKRHFFKYLKLFFKSLELRDQDASVVGFPGQEVMFWLGRFLKRPIIFDALTSHYGGYILDRGYFPKNSLQAKYYSFLDQRSCKLADIVLLDTQAHIDFFVNEFGLLRSKFRRIFVGADSAVFYPDAERQSGLQAKTIIHFHGNYIPLQGVEYIVRAANLLKEESIIFNLIGLGQTYKSTRELADKLKLQNINFLEPVPYEKLPGYINQANICLGIFGNTPKTDLVIPNKVYEAVACKKAVITADTPAIRELFKDRINILLVNKADPRDLAEKILFLKNNVSHKEQIANNGYTLFQNRLTPEKLGGELIKIINEAVALSK